ncbi:Selenide, water dikinase 2 [Frankliniella fusca]|uniref:Selenide, water dikinase 2 n=1 Tax=Frankliniella fusca TaxID=407009 RepID=A0AAE1HCC9_9NEOP|nr:Selenide, water dikinase 2 [Frankliniella fusca]
MFFSKLYFWVPHIRGGAVPVLEAGLANRPGPYSCLDREIWGGSSVAPPLKHGKKKYNRLKLPKRIFKAEDPSGAEFSSKAYCAVYELTNGFAYML